MPLSKITFDFQAILFVTVPSLTCAPNFISAMLPSFLRGRRMEIPYSLGSFVSFSIEGFSRRFPGQFSAALAKLQNSLSEAALTRFSFDQQLFDEPFP